MNVKSSSLARLPCFAMFSCVVVVEEFFAYLQLHDVSGLLLAFTTLTYFHKVGAGTFVWHKSNRTYARHKKSTLELTL